MRKLILLHEARSFRRSKPVQGALALLRPTLMLAIYAQRIDADLARDLRAIIEALIVAVLAE
jgi:hypothetical protein